MLAKARALGASPGRAEEAVALYRALLEQAGEDATADAEQFGTFLRTTTTTPERAADFRWLYEWRVRHSANPADVLAEWAAIEAVAKELADLTGLVPGSVPPLLSPRLGSESALEW